MGHAKHAGHGATKAPAGPGKNLDQLNRFLNGELSAVATYKLALDSLERASKTRSNLESCLQSHQQRVAVLRAAIEKLGGQPSHDVHAWDAIVTMIESGAEVIGDRDAVAALGEGEDHELADYRQDLAALDAAGRQLIELQVLPKQVQTTHIISELKKTLH
jgi:hypothetical protein